MPTSRRRAPVTARRAAAATYPTGPAEQFAQQEGDDEDDDRDAEA